MTGLYYLANKLLIGKKALNRKTENERAPIEPAAIILPGIKKGLAGKTARPNLLPGAAVACC